MHSSSLVLSQKAPKKVTPLQNFFQKNFSSLPGLFPKTPSNVPLIVNFFQKNSPSTGDYQEKVPQSVTPEAHFFSKKLPSLMLSQKHPEKVIKLRPDKLEKVCRFYYKKYSKRLILRLTLSLGLIYYKQSLYLPTTTMAKKWKHHTKNFGNF